MKTTREEVQRAARVIFGNPKRFKAYTTAAMAAEVERYTGVPIPKGYMLPGREGTRYDLVVCLPVSFPDFPPMFTDNVLARCADGCGRVVQHRPHAPPLPPKVCIICAAARPSRR